jgi:uncharacterized lipoprotein YmbA
MKHAFALNFACFLLISLSGCSSGPPRPSLLQLQIEEAKAALSRGEITMAEYLKLKQQAVQAAELRRTIMLASPD